MEESRTDERVIVEGTNGYPPFGVTYDPNTPEECKKCGAPIYWAQTSKKKTMSIEFSKGKWCAHHPNCK